MPSKGQGFRLETEIKKTQQFEYLHSIVAYATPYTRAPAFLWKSKRTWIRSARWPFRPFISCHARAHDRTQKQEKSCKCMSVAMCARLLSLVLELNSSPRPTSTVRRRFAAEPVFPPPPGRRKKHWIYILYINTHACVLEPFINGGVSTRARLLKWFGTFIPNFNTVMLSTRCTGRTRVVWSLRQEKIQKAWTQNMLF